MAHRRLVIFDLDGTIVDAYPAIIDSFNYCMKVLGYAAQQASVIRRAVGWGDKNLLAPFLKTQEVEKALVIYRKHHARALRSKTRLFPGVRRLLRLLRDNGDLVCVASNRPTRFSWVIIRHLGLEKYFDYVLCADKLRMGKPHPEILTRIMKRYHVPSSFTFYVGDMAIDAQAGRRAGVKTIVVTTGSSSKTELKKERPFAIIPRISELPRFLC
ncbi:MAG: HAD family hydrolase [Candidatus Omnitrophica bacterium]|nr:HAD family hydrolase [Candidatus Omnitrophota bacterium]